MYWTLTRETTVARFGHDEGGHWIEVTDGMIVARHDATEHGFDGDRPVLSILTVLCEYGFIADDDVREALARLDGRPDSGRRPSGPGVRRVLRIIERLRLASGE
ncbi:MAG TPA: hypothetical protein VGD55_00560 [Acidothermaceae bacterium]